MKDIEHYNLTKNIEYSQRAPHGGLNTFKERLNTDKHFEKKCRPDFYYAVLTIDSMNAINVKKINRVNAAFNSRFKNAGKNLVQ